MISGLRTAVAATLATVGLVAFAPSAGARPVPASQHALAQHATTGSHASSLGETRVQTLPGIAGTFLKLGILPLPQLPKTGFSVSFDGGLRVAYYFPITGSTADLAAGTGDITHDGGIVFVSRSAKLSIGGFDVDLAAGKIFATKVNGAAARVPILDLDLSALTVSKEHGATVLRTIKLSLDPVAAGVLNSTFGISLPTDGSLTFGYARVTLS